jgi:hypothetical protein
MPAAPARVRAWSGVLPIRRRDALSRGIAVPH